MDNRFFEHPILNSPYAYPRRHWELDDQAEYAAKQSFPEMILEQLNAAGDQQAHDARAVVRRLHEGRHDPGRRVARLGRNTVAAHNLLLDRHGLSRSRSRARRVDSADAAVCERRRTGGSRSSRDALASNDC
jgi:hypothetical protein